MLVKSNDRVPQYDEVQYVIFTETKLSGLQSVAQQSTTEQRTKKVRRILWI